MGFRCCVCSWWVIRWQRVGKKEVGIVQSCARRPVPGPVVSEHHCPLALSRPTTDAQITNGPLHPKRAIDR